LSNSAFGFLDLNEKPNYATSEQTADGDGIFSIQVIFDSDKSITLRKTV